MQRSGRWKVVVVGLFVAGLLIGGALALLGELSSAPGVDQGRPITVEIPEGVGASQVAELLADRGIIASPFAFKLVARFDDRAARIRPGTYVLRSGMSSGEILGVLSDGPAGPATFRVTLPEGLTVDQSLERIASTPGSPFDVDELEAALGGLAVPSWVPVERLPAEAQAFEGLLFPDTYEFRVDADPEDVLMRLVEHTDQVLSEIGSPAVEELDRYELLTIGSLIEREARVAAEQPLISAVIHNRLDADMPLQVDATVLYALGEHRDRVLYEDTDIDSPWNTYRIEGLPPTPIAAPGRAALEAAARPAAEDYLYYVVSDPATGAHAFASTKAEHDDNVRRYRRGGG